MEPCLDAFLSFDFDIRGRGDPCSVRRGAEQSRAMSFAPGFKSSRSPSISGSPTRQTGCVSRSLNAATGSPDETQLGSFAMLPSGENTPGFADRAAGVRRLHPAGEGRADGLMARRVLSPPPARRSRSSSHRPAFTLLARPRAQNDLLCRRLPGRRSGAFGTMRAVHRPAGGERGANFRSGQPDIRGLGSC